MKFAKFQKYSKYKAQKTEVDGIVFDSKKEAGRYQDLKLLERAGEITGLELQPEYPIVVNGFKVCVYKADFRYKTKAGDLVVEDVKGPKVGAGYAMFRLKAKLTHACYGIDVKEV